MGFDYDFPTATTPVDTANMAALADSGDADVTAAELFKSGFTVRRIGDFIFPVTIEVVFPDGETIRENWDGEADWQKFSYVKSTEIVSATVDPDHHLVMDVNFTNNRGPGDRTAQQRCKQAFRTLAVLDAVFDGSAGVAQPADNFCNNNREF
ncbi:MAG: hypothetical protein R3C26_09940 [Calditrichia bacterium]